MTIAAQTSSQIQIDPTKNVLDLVAAESRYRDAMRRADEKFQNAMREAERRRQDDLYAQKAEFDRMQATTLRLQVENNATLFLAQMNQGFNSFNERISKLEQFRYESSGKGQGGANVFSYVAMFITTAIVVFFGVATMLKHA